MTTETVCYRHADRATGLRCSKCERPICVDCSIDAVVGQRCPECSKDLGTTRVQRMTTMSPLDGAPFTRAIIGITVVFYLLQRVDEVYLNLVYFGPLAADGELWRMVTVVLLHGGLWHIGFNMYALYIFGPAIERSLGRSAFASLYLLTAAVGSLFVYVISDPRTQAVGASGAIFGLLGMWVYRAYRLRDTAMGKTQLRQYGIMIALNAALPLFIPNVAWEAHVGGFGAGVLAAIIFATIKDRKIATAVVVALTIVALAVPLVLSPGLLS